MYLTLKLLSEKSIDDCGFCQLLGNNLALEIFILTPPYSSLEGKIKIQLISAG